MEWKTIDSAPKDGSHILIVNNSVKNSEADVVHWSSEDGLWRASKQDCWKDAKGMGGEILGWYDCPTHWMPLPVAPKAD